MTYKELYNQMLDEIYGEIKIGNLSYSASYILEKVDPIAYRCGFLDLVNSEGFGDVDFDDEVKEEKNEKDL